MHPCLSPASLQPFISDPEIQRRKNNTTLEPNLKGTNQHRSRNDSCSPISCHSNMLKHHCAIMQRAHSACVACAQKLSLENPPMRLPSHLLPAREKSSCVNSCLFDADAAAFASSSRQLVFFTQTLTTIGCGEGCQGHEISARLVFPNSNVLTLRHEFSFLSVPFSLRVRRPSFREWSWRFLSLYGCSFPRTLKTDGKIVKIVKENSREN